MQKFLVAVIAAISVCVLAGPVQAEKPARLQKESKFKDADCRKPTWENLSLVMLDATLSHEEVTVDKFAPDGGIDEIMGGSLYCEDLVARFTPKKFEEIESRFDLRKACEKAKKAAKKRLEEYRENRCFVAYRHDKLGKYDFSSNSFPIKDLDKKGTSVPVSGKLKEIDFDWPSPSFNTTWIMAPFRLTVPQVIEKLPMKADKAESFASDNDRVFVKYKFTLNGDYEMERTGINNGIYKIEAWMYESGDMENLLAKDRNFDAIGFSSNPADNT